jgi:hypothetical protein
MAVESLRFSIPDISPYVRQENGFEAFAAKGHILIIITDHLAHNPTN